MRASKVSLEVEVQSHQIEMGEKLLIIVTSLDLLLGVASYKFNAVPQNCYVWFNHRLYSIFNVLSINLTQPFRCL